MSSTKGNNETEVSYFLHRFIDTRRCYFSLKRKVAPFLYQERGLIMKNKKITKMVLSALFLAIAYVLPFFTGQIPEIGAMLCPMHIPVLLTGFICGWPWGILVGFISPLLRSVALGMPPMFPTAICMAFELAVYGGVAGFLHKGFPKKKAYIFLSLIISMLLGRIVWGGAMYICMGIKGAPFTLSAFFAGAVLNAVPGIILQLILIPAVIILLQRAKVIK